TSGSTGNPKGNLTVHQNVVKTICNNGYLEVSEHDRVLQLSNYAFDGSTFDIYTALLNGATLVVISKEAALDVKELSNIIRKENISISFMTTALFNTIVDYDLTCLQEVRKVLFGGEKVSINHVEKALAYLGEHRMFHVYGPTETTVFATTYSIDNRVKDMGTVPIGRPLNNTEAYILDPSHQPVPIGVTGELYIGGEGLARGYLNRPDLTEERFISHPFKEGERLYRTGDLVKYLPDGNIDFLGREDHQVKIRGFRIELGEIEGALCEFPSVNEAIVLVREDHPGNRALVAYIVGEGSVAEWKEHLKKQLPSYMVPAHFVSMESFPLTPNGKVDRKAFPASSQEHVGGHYIAPRTPLEEQIVTIWEQVLRIEKIGVGDSFFELGGHSLLATQVVSCLQETFLLDLPLREIFTYPTVEALAERIEQLRQEEKVSFQPSEVTTINKEDFLKKRLQNRKKTKPEKIRKKPEDAQATLSLNQEGLWLSQQMDQASSKYNVPIYLIFEGKLDVEALTYSINEIVKRHDGLRTNFINKRGKPHPIIHAYQPIDIEIHLLDMKGRPEIEAIQSAMKNEATYVFDLEKDPLYRFTIYKIEKQKHILTINIHHMITDGWSLDIIGRELEANYLKYLGETFEPLEELPIQYEDYAYWQREQISSTRFEKRIDYWKEKLRGHPPELKLPLDRPRSEEVTDRGAIETEHITQETVHQMKEIGQQEGATLFMSFLAAYKMLLYTYSNQNDILVGSPVANRTMRETQNVIGYFNNNLVLRTKLDEDGTFHDLIAQVRDVVLTSSAYQDVPYGKMIEKINPKRDKYISPFFQVWFVMDHKKEDSQLPSLTMKFPLLGAHSGRSKWDLTLGLTEVEGGMQVIIEYKPDLFNKTTIQTILRSYLFIVERVLAEPTILLSQLKEEIEKEEQRYMEEQKKKRSHDRKSAFKQFKLKMKTK
ncbi:amino acid adenylation domain-containing protein, partial [Bacillus spongiae]